MLNTHPGFKPEMWLGITLLLETDYSVIKKVMASMTVLLSTDSPVGFKNFLSWIIQNKHKQKDQTMKI